MTSTDDEEQRKTAALAELDRRGAKLYAHPENQLTASALELLLATMDRPADEVRAESRAHLRELDRGLHLDAVQEREEERLRRARRPWWQRLF